MQKKPLSVLLSFLKVGIIGFGGGAALIPVIENELVENKKWIEKKDFDTAVAVACISPASLPVSLCSIWDSRYALMSAYAYALPGPLLYLFILTGFSFIGLAGMTYLKYTSVGLIAFVLFLLYRFVRKNYVHGKQTGIQKQYLLIVASAFILTCGSVLQRLALLLFDLATPVPVFSIDMVTLIIATIFVFCFTGKSKSRLKYAAALSVAGLYALSNGKRGIFGQFTIPVIAVMVVMTATSILYDAYRYKSNTNKAPVRFDIKPLRNLILFLMIALVLVSLTYFFSGDANVWDFAGRVLTSSLSSFGGGEVYIGISESYFVQTGFIPEEIYNTQIIGIANSMPGPVLVSIVAGIGYSYGNITHGVGFGWVFGLLGLSLAVTATAFGVLVLFMCFGFLKDSFRLHMVISYIMPVVCGMLISTALSLLRQASSVLINEGFNPFASVGSVLAIFLFMLLLHKKYRVKDLILLLIGGAGTLVTLSAIC